MPEGGIGEDSPEARLTRLQSNSPSGVTKFVNIVDCI